jgi:hypothetical protein
MFRMGVSTRRDEAIIRRRTSTQTALRVHTDL